MCYVSDIALYSIRSGIFSQWSFWRIGVMWWCFEVLVTLCSALLYEKWFRNEFVLHLSI